MVTSWQDVAKNELHHFRLFGVSYVAARYLYSQRVRYDSELQNDLCTLAQNVVL